MVKSNIVILGGGFAGLRATLDLSRELARLKLADRYAITLIDRNQFHTFTPLLYEVATTTEGMTACATLKSLAIYPFGDILRGTRVNLVSGDITDISLAHRSVRVAGSDIHFDYLLFALGSESADFGIPGVKQYSYPLKTVADALRIRDAVVARWHSTPDHIDIAVVGGGPTGAELACELRAWTDELRITTKKIPDVHLRIIERETSILAGFHPSVVAAALKRLQTLDVEVRVESPLARIGANMVTIASGESIPADLCIWTAGVQGPKAADGLPFSRGPRGRIAVSETLGGIPADSPFAQRVYIAGDSSWLEDTATGRSMPQTAPVAAKQGAVAAKNILAAIVQECGAAERRPHAFRLRTYPYILPLGGKYAVARIGPFVIRGTVAWMFKGIVELEYLTSIFPLVHALKLWLRGFRTFLFSDRLG